jgi:hypothetical protein
MEEINPVQKENHCFYFFFKPPTSTFVSLQILFVFYSCMELTCLPLPSLTIIIDGAQHGTMQMGQWVIFEKKAKRRKG